MSGAVGPLGRHPAVCMVPFLPHNFSQRLARGNVWRFGRHRHYGGTGLGLSIVKELTVLHGGSVRIDDGPEGGARFTLQLPRKALTDAVIDENEPAIVPEEIGRQLVDELRNLKTGGALTPAPSISSSQTVLVVEDNRDMNTYLNSILQPHYRVLSAFTGNEGLQLAKENRPDLIISDIMMPGMSGDAMVEQIRQRKELKDVPILILTAKADDNLEINMLSGGVQDYIRKPFNSEELLARVRSILGERLASQGILQESEDRLRLALEAAHMGTFDWNLATNHIVWTRWHEEIWGMMPGEFDGSYKAETKRIHPEDLPGFNDELKRCMEEHEPFNCEFRVVWPDGSKHWVMASGEFTYDAVGQPLRMHGVVMETTERKRAEAVLAESERRFRELLETVNLLAVMLDHEAHVIFCNKFFLQVTGWNREEVLGTDWFEKFTPAEDQKHLQARFKKFLTEKDSLYQIEGPLCTKSGKIRTVVWDHTLLCNPEGAVSGLARLGRDITDQIQLEAQLKQAQKMEAIGRLAGGVAHDFNNILQGINGSAEFAARGIYRDSPAYEDLMEIFRSVNRAQTLVRQLLIFSRREKPQKKNLSIGELVSGSAKMLNRVIGEHMQLEIVSRDAGYLICADPGQIEQVLMNLCVNAKDAMPEGGTIRIFISHLVVNREFRKLNPWAEEGDYVLLKISDTGQGMTPETIEHIFEPLLHHQRSGAGYRAWTGHCLWHCPTA
jgi:PAS domain S-box-containing protein